MTPQTPSPRRPWAALVGLAAAAAVAVGALALVLTRAPEGARPAASAQDAACRGRAFAEIGGPFQLVDQTGAAVSEKTYLGRPALLYFGFTHCPDICPFSLQTMAAALAAAGPDARRIQPLFITVDPERDTPEMLAAYVTSNGFPPGLQGLTGTPAQVAAAAKAFRVGYQRVDDPAASDYLIDHTSIFYLLDSKGKLATFFSHGTAPDTMGACLRDLLADGL